MALLAALALAGAMAAESLSARWGGGAAAAILVQVPPGVDPQAAARRIAALPNIAEAVPLDRARLSELLRPLIGSVDSLPLPVLIEIRLMSLNSPAELATTIQMAVPGASVEAHGVWIAQLLDLVVGMQRLAWVVLLLVAAVSMILVVITTRSGLSALRGTIGILHDMGTTDRMIADRFAARLAWLSALGAVAGSVAAVPVLLVLAMMAASILGPVTASTWIGIASIPVVAALIAWLTAQLTVRHWLRALP